MLKQTLNKGISTPIAIGIVAILVILVGGFTWWQYGEIRKEETKLPEIELPEKEGTISSFDQLYKLYACSEDSDCVLIGSKTCSGQTIKISINKKYESSYTELRSKYFNEEICSQIGISADEQKQINESITPIGAVCVDNTCKLKYPEEEISKEETPKKEIINWETYRNEEYEYEINIPEDWEVVEAVPEEEFPTEPEWGGEVLRGLELQKTTFIEKEYIDWGGVFQIRVLLNPDKLTLEEWAENYKRESATGYNLIRNISDTSIAGEPAKRFSIFGFDHEEIEVVTIKKGNIYILDFTGSSPNDSEEERHQQIYSQILSTFKFIEAEEIVEKDSITSPDGTFIAVRALREKKGEKFPYDAGHEIRRRKSESGQKFLPLNPLPFCPPERKLSKIGVGIFLKKSSDFVQERQQLSERFERPRGVRNRQVGGFLIE